MIKIKIPKFHIKINLFLWAVFAVIILAELFLLYKYLYRNPKRHPPASVQQTPSLRIDFDASAKAAKWFDAQAAYELPNYILDKGAVGRENPLAEY